MILSNEHLYSELRNTKFTTVDAFRLYLDAINQRILEVNPKIAYLWESLLKWVPTEIIQAQEYFVSTTLTQSLPLFSLLEELILFSPNGLMGQPDNRFSLPMNLGSTEVWGGEKLSLPVEMNTDVITVDRYWWELFVQLNRWREITKAELQTAEWELKDNTVDLVIKWKGSFERIDQCISPDFRDGFWKVASSTEFPVHLSATSNVFLLRTQLMASIGGNKLLPIKLDNYLLTISLQMTKASTKKSPIPDQIMSREEFNSINKYIYLQIIPGYSDTSKQLEAELASEIIRLESFAISGDIDEQWVVRFKEALRELILIREKLENLGGIV